jgi:hypothetical protein
VWCCVGETIEAIRAAGTHVEFEVVQDQEGYQDLLALQKLHTQRKLTLRDTSRNTPQQAPAPSGSSAKSTRASSKTTMPRMVENSVDSHASPRTPVSQVDALLALTTTPIS